jgi:lycopene beta-cyclase
MNGRTTTSRVEIAIVGGGLAGGLIALALRQARPELSVRLYEAGPVLGGNHRWSWFDGDLDERGHALLAPFRKIRWRGYSVRFPAHRRALHARYNSLASADFDAALRRELGQETIHTDKPVAGLDSGGITLADGSRVSARTVIDCRDTVPDGNLRGGWQVFMGRQFRTDRPHGLTQPVVMDADVTQHGAYRFVYTLPLGVDELFVEDTYYADSPVLDRSALSSRIDQYCAEQGWSGTILHGETGVLPVITGGDFASWQRGSMIDGVARAGAGGGFVHPLTSYTLPFAVETALLIADEADLSGEQLAAVLADRARRHWAHTRFYRALGRMLFDAAEPDQRYRIFERFYRLPQPLIERFYAARSTMGDRLRILSGKPPVSIIRAMSALAGKGAPLTERHLR